MMNKTIYHIKNILFIFFLLLSEFSYAQWHEVVYNELSGMQNSLVKSVDKDSLGFVWSATDRGLIRFDGSNFLQVTEGLPSLYVKKIFTTSKGILLASTDLGVVKINMIDNQPKVETVLQGDTYASDTLLWYPKSIYETKDQKIWICDNHSIVCLDTALNQIARYKFYEKDLPTNFQRSFSLLEDPVLGLYAFSEAGYLYKFSKKENVFNEIQLITQSDRINHAFFYQKKMIVSTQSGVTEITLDKSGKDILSQRIIFDDIAPSYVVVNTENEWFAGTWNDGLYRIKIDKKGNYHHFKVGNVEQKVISSVFKDESSGIWLSTDNGMIYLKEQYFKAAFEKDAYQYIQTIVQDNNQVLFSDGRTLFFCSTSNHKMIDKWEISSEYGIVLKVAHIENEYWLTTNIGLFLIYDEDGNFKRKIDCSNYGGAIYSIAYNEMGDLWYVQDHGGLFKLQNLEKIISYGREEGITSKINVLKFQEGRLFLGGSKDGNYFFKYNVASDNFENLSKPISIVRNVSLSVNDFVFIDEGPILATNFGLAFFAKDSLRAKTIAHLNLGDVKGVINDYRSSNVIWLTNSNGLIRVKDWKSFLVFDELSGLPSKTMSYRTILLDNFGAIWTGTASGVGLSNKKVAIKKTPTPVFTYIGNSIGKFRFTAIPEISAASYLDIKFASLTFPGNLISYQFKYNDGKWKDIGWNNKIIVSGLEKGDYTIFIRAKQIGEYMWSESATFSFIVTDAWYRTWYGILSIFSIMLGIGFVSFKLYDEKVQYDKEILEGVVKERTQQIEAQNKILSGRESILKKQVDRFKKVNDKLNYQKQEMNNRLIYARDLQSVVLPPVEKINSFYTNSFLLYKPKEIVSGDFYWEKTFNKNISYIVVADCIGHGIPGAIQSLIGIDLLGEIIDNKDVKTDYVLEELDIRLKEKAKENPALIGIDMLILRVFKNEDQFEISYAGARRPLFYFMDNELIEIKGTRRGIGNEPAHVKVKGFEVHNFILPKGVSIYLTTNGYYDQFNNQEKRMGISKFRKLLIEAGGSNDMLEQRKWLENYLNVWSSEADQIDDITILGLQL
ncbi:hypothetical protein EI427_01970 [Flammeovirga pectinis]|uniref:PPM-type phosphatase domain-containing protein n=1 Tax=Flammeovirga pectinis TaxID=2494373 RepID=A0A3Q9FL31_9BACT|nr:SpoIIE family protein phosphatase [Flammeovirga pectinis]AZQ61026.1 hypothetical protein EI427_01970 [Flammeovirga pectinis]